MDIILQTLKELPKKLYEIDLTSQGIGEFIGRCQAICNETILAYASERIAELDSAILSSNAERGDWKAVKCNVPRSVETKAGLLEYHRRYYRNIQTKEYAYLADHALQIESYQRVEDHLELALVKSASEMSYRSASASVCEGRVSPSTVMNIIRKIEIPEEKPKESKKRVEELHIQADEDHVHLQKGID